MRSTLLPSLALVLTTASCGCLAAGCKNRPSTPAVHGGDAATAPMGSSAIEPKPASWVDDVRRERFAEAARAIDARPESERKRADIRYLRARLAVELGDGATALRMLEGLESALPLLAQDVLERRG
jgi:hypothetical protein